MSIDYKFLRHMAAVVDGIPEFKLNLENFIGSSIMGDEGANNPHNCGTVACAFGWMGMHPDAHARGVAIDKWGIFSIDGKEATTADAGERLFGIDYEEFWQLFNDRYGTRRYAIPLPDESDKDLFRRRITAFLEEHEQTSAHCIARGEEP